MYSSIDRPLIVATIFYYDHDYSSDYYPRKILEILKKYDFGSPRKIYGGILTRGKYINCKNNFEEVFIKSYTKNDVYNVHIKLYP